MEHNAGTPFEQQKCSLTLHGSGFSESFLFGKTTKVSLSKKMRAQLKKKLLVLQMLFNNANQDLSSIGNLLQSLSI
jgi:hypothetical protein